ncbi:Gfo/Idh/MocA family oxidoreductase [Pseudophaeobacter sp.]|uniref:Gfo/Idh/MocA family protein n=1 Tax=Pseudophaeobacter sp. TaxID=1971739 RepID=UPI00329985E0
MNIAFVGCGFVFDIYMRTRRAHPELTVVGLYDIRPDRLQQACAYYGLTAFPSLEALLADPKVDLVVNLTNIHAHVEISRKALKAGKHVYSEKPIALSVEDCQALFDLAAEKNVTFSGAPSNIFADNVRTLFRAVETGKIGKPLLVYAELDDNPIHKMEFQKVLSPSGAPWPLAEEVREGCTYEHVGYHLIWICALLGPVTRVTAYSKELIAAKDPTLEDFVGVPDYSVACLDFANGATARVTCSVVAPRDHRMRVIGHDAEISTDSYRHYRAPVYLESFTKAGLSARKFRTLRDHLWLGRRLGIGGRKIKLARNWKSEAVEKHNQPGSSLKTRAVEWLRRREVYAQDKFIGIAEQVRSLQQGTPQYLTPSFLMHINELTLMIQNAGTEGICQKPTTDFEPLGPIPGTL